MRFSLALGLVGCSWIGFVACSSDDDGAAAPTTGSDAGSGADDAASAGDGSTSADGATASDSGNDGGAQVDGGGDAAPPGYDVKSLPGLVLWLDSENGVDLSKYPAKWTDQSAAGNHAVQPNTCGKADRNAETLNAHKAVGFHETECFEIPDTASLQWGTGDFYVGVVARNNYNKAQGDGGTTFTYQDGSYVRRRYGEVYSKIASLFGPGPTVVFNDWTDRSFKIVGSADLSQMAKTPSVFAEPAHLIGFRRKGGVLELRIDGVVKTSLSDAGAPIDVSSVGTPVAIGGRAGLTNFVGSIWEVVAIKGASSDADLGAFEAYAIAKYKVPGPS